METLTPNISDNAFMTSLILLYALMNILAWGKNGLFKHEISMLTDLRNVRTFNVEDTFRSKLSLFLYIQYFLFFGLCLFFIIRPSALAELSDTTPFQAEAVWQLAISFVAPVVWYFLHYFLIHWFCYIIGGDSRIVIIDRIYKAVHLLCGPIVMILFTFIVTAGISAFLVSVLLTAIFIITQIVFLFSGIKIFYNGFGSLCLFFVYLCALEIAPLAVIAVKLG